MKKFLALILACMMLLGVAAAETAEVVSSASLVDYYGASALTGEDLKNAINSYSGTYLVGSVDEEGNQNIGYFIFGMVEKDGEYYLQLGLADNLSKANLKATGKLIAVYAAAPSEKPFATAGAHIWAEMVTDEELFNALNTAGSATVMFFHVTEVRPLG